MSDNPSLTWDADPQTATLKTGRVQYDAHYGAVIELEVCADTLVYVSRSGVVQNLLHGLPDDIGEAEIARTLLGFLNAMVNHPSTRKAEKPRRRLVLAQGVPES